MKRHATQPRAMGRQRGPSTNIASTLHQNSTNRYAPQIVCAIPGRQNLILQNSSQAPILGENQLLLPRTEVCALRSCRAEPRVHKIASNTDRYILTPHLNTNSSQCNAIILVRQMDTCEQWEATGNAWRRQHCRCGGK